MLKYGAQFFYPPHSPYFYYYFAVSTFVHPRLSFSYFMLFIAMGTLSLNTEFIANC